MRIHIPKSYIVIGLILAICIAIGAYSSRSPQPDTYKCPNDYATVEEYIDSFGVWLKAEQTKNPMISEADLVAKRLELFQSHSCQKSKWEDVTAI